MPSGNLTYAKVGMASHGSMSVSLKTKTPQAIQGATAGSPEVVQLIVNYPNWGEVPQERNRVRPQGGLSEANSGNPEKSWLQEMSTVTTAI